ncbi:MAG: hypothetical protein E7653_00135 [Ruminococcaceae bacterium]|nr:hypothetical protein [Oscillospiraceae bacterium]
MSVVDVKFYHCDICPKTFAKPGVLEPVLLPARQYDKDGKNYVVKSEAVDLCPSCYDAFFNLIDKEFATIELGAGERHIYSYLKENKESEDVKEDQA